MAAAAETITPDAQDGAAHGASVPVAEGFEADPGSPLPDLDADGGRAFAAVATRDRASDYFVVVCERGLVQRRDAAAALKEHQMPGAVRLVAAGAAHWPTAGGRRVTLVYERPAGQRVVASLGARREPMTEEQLSRWILAPLASTLKDFANRQIAHGSIRPDTLRFREGSQGPVMLGECVSAPAGLRQPPAFETIERALCEPLGKGDGTMADDMFALGVTVLWLAVGSDPFAGTDAAQLMEARMDRGSYAAMCVNQKIPGAISEVLRGLLADDPKQRWSVKDLDQWVAGRRLAPKQSNPPRRAPRPLDVGGIQCWNARMLAQAFAREPAKAAPLIETGEVDRWLRRSLMDDDAAEDLHQAVHAAGYGPASGSLDRLVARAAVALDPRGPIRYRGRAVMPHGIGAAMHADAAAGRPLDALAEIVGAQLPVFWIQRQGELRSDVAGMQGLFEQLRVALDRQLPGYGPERALYELAPDGSCLSPMTGGDWVGSPAELLAALDAAGQRKSRPNEPMDRHVAGFLMARHRKLDDRFFGLLAPGTAPGRRSLAMLAILADTQRAFGPPVLRGVAQWMLPLLRASMERFRNRQLHAKLQRDLEEAASAGDLSRLLAVLDDPKAVRSDGDGFAEARREYDRLTGEIEAAERSLADPAAVAAADGRPIAAAAAGALAAVLVFAVLMLGIGG
jgi:hypothetical protein